MAEARAGDLPTVVGKRPRWAGPLIIAVVSLLLGGLVGWAVAEVLRPEEGALAELPYSTATVTQGVVSQSLALNAQAEWSASGSVANRAVGTVTSVDVVAGSEVTAGQRLYSVDLRPVRAAQGTIPMHRDLAAGARGADVAQLQHLLVAVGADPGRTDGVFDGGTEAAVRAWQAAEGSDVTGDVAMRDLVFLPQLPTRVRLDETIVHTGAILSGGEPAITGLGAPRFTIALDDRQAQLVPASASVTVQGPNATWSAVIERVDRAESGAVAVLVAEGGHPVCGDDCSATVSTADPTLFPAQIALVPETSGATVPSAAVATEVDGKAVVVAIDGTQHPVTVIASAQGISVVDGVADGTQVRVPAASGTTP